MTVKCIEGVYIYIYMYNIYIYIYMYMYPYIAVCIFLNEGVMGSLKGISGGT